MQTEPLTEKRNFDRRGSLDCMRATSWKEFEFLYHDHARATGFSVRKSTIRKIDGIIHERHFVCSKQGTTETKIKENERIMPRES